LERKDEDMFTEINALAEKYGAKLIVVSKTRPNKQIIEIYNQGQRQFAENRVQDLLEKKDSLPEDIEWHLIGHLQTNKVKYIAPFIAMVHSVDSYKIWKELDQAAFKSNRKIPILLQVKIANEDSKYGFQIEEIESILEQRSHAQLISTPIHGLMGMATFTNDQNQIRAEFKQLKYYFDCLKDKYQDQIPFFNEISMGMSSDYEIALEEGSTMLRIGSTIFDAF
jgi:pyridoxal phosphate enzyme (YggS family)